MNYYSFYFFNKIDKIINIFITYSKINKNMKNLPTNSSTFYDALYKIILVGDTSVGKTSFLRRYNDNIFSEDVLSTMGIKY
jgi:hypothetical protein